MDRERGHCAKRGIWIRECRHQCLFKKEDELPTEILVFHCHGAVPHPYVLDNVANQGGTINLSMQWITPSHLRVSYSGHPELNLQMVKYWGVEITAQDLSEPPKVVESPH